MQHFFVLFVSSSQCHLVALSSRDLFISMQIRSCKKTAWNLNKNYSSAPVCVCVRERDTRTNNTFLVQSRETHWKLKPNYSRPFMGVVGKGVSLLSLPVFPCSGLAEQDRAFLAHFVLELFSLCELGSKWHHEGGQCCL